MIEAWVAGSVSVTVITEGTPNRITTTAKLQDVDTTLQMTGKTWKETVMTTGAGQGENGITKSPRGKMTEKEGTIEIEERGTDLPRGVEVVHPHPLVKALIPPFGVGEAKMTIEMPNQIGDQLTRNRKCDLRKGAKGCNTFGTPATTPSDSSWI